MSTLNNRITRIEESNVKTSAETNVTTKEIYERIIALETKFDMGMSNDDSARRYFRKGVYLLVVLELLNLVVHFMK